MTLAIVQGNYVAGAFSCGVIVNVYFSSIKFSADQGTGHAAVILYCKWPATKSLRKNLLTQKVDF